jgi:prepilin-type processing-associated H-X9-DG protein
MTRDGGCCVINCTQGLSPDGQFYALHPGGANALRTDGSVMFLKESTAPSMLAALITRAGGEVVNED